MPKTQKSDKKSKSARSRTVPYAKGFHPPLELEKHLAITRHNRPSLSREFLDHSEPDKKFFKSIPQPTSIDDWLAQYVEEGQTYSEYLQENPWFSRRKQKFMRQKFKPSGDFICDKYPDGKIYIAKIGNSTPRGVNFNDLLDFVRKFLCMPVEVLEGLDIEEKNGQLTFVVDPSRSPSGRPGVRIRRSSLKVRQNLKAKHLQIGVDSVLPKMRSIIPDDALCLIGLTEYDLYGDDTDLFVAGMAAGSARVAVFSLFRYSPILKFSQEFWFDIQESNKVTDEEFKCLMLQRSCKLVVHEICHLLGIPHCIYYSCCMNGSGHLEEDFVQPMMLCPVDLHKLQTLIGFNIVKRYESLLEFYTKHKMNEEATWMKERLKFIQSYQS